MCSGNIHEICGPCFRGLWIDEEGVQTYLCKLLIDASIHIELDELQWLPRVSLRAVLSGSLSSLRGRELTLISIAQIG